MTFFFDVSEIFQFAIKIEENGVKFYQNVAQIVGDDLKDIFLYLADEEITHRRKFEELVFHRGTYEPFERYSGEYLTYLQAYIDTIIFTDDYSVQNLAIIMKLCFKSLATRGISKRIRWIIYCPACMRTYKDRTYYDICPICGTKLKRRPIKKAKVA